MDYPSHAIAVEMSDLIKSDAFAEQICHLHKEKCNREIADMPRPKNVLQWLIGAMSNRDSHVAADFPVVSKKMRDEPGTGYRRSGLWISMKAFLQLSLTITLGETHGTYMYKLIVMKVMAAVCNRLSECACAELSLSTIDTAVEMIAKVARRIEKLTNYSDVTVFTQLTAEVKAETCESIAKVRKLVQAQHQKVQRKETKKNCDLRKLAFNDVHKLSRDLTSYLEQRKNANYRIPVKDEVPKVNIEINFDPATPPIIHRITELPNENSDEMFRVLCDAENWVLTYLGETHDERDVRYLRDLATQYFEKARHFYRDEPVGYSRMVLTILKIIQVSNNTVMGSHIKTE